MDHPALNPLLAPHLTQLVSSYQHYTGQELVSSCLKGQELVDFLFNAPFILLSHNTQPDPLLNYGNKKALELWEMTWDEFIQTPSRVTAEPPIQSEREILLRRVKMQGFIDNYAGIRISKTKKRFCITQATVWNIVDQNQVYQGQAACFSHWQYV
ncbi:MEKHLA domain-containing protein [bacterium]|nr:MEKHLA domain-containing protein [bacterium]